jgi:hypothetical protein
MESTPSAPRYEPPIGPSFVELVEQMNAERLRVTAHNLDRRQWLKLISLADVREFDADDEMMRERWARVGRYWRQVQFDACSSLNHVPRLCFDWCRARLE